MCASRPLIGIPACRKEIGIHYYHAVGEKYIVAVAEVVEGLPLLIPALGEGLGVADVLDRVDGLLLTGSYSNIEPRRYQGSSSEPGTLHDPQRDATTLALIPAAVAAGVPILAICRGCQEMNVAFGGSLHQKVHEVAGMQDHREDPTQAVDIQYGPAHEVVLTPGGLLERLAGCRRVRVNSLHWQGVDRLGAGLAVEARSPDGLVEAFRVENAPAFALAVQWHSEWKVRENPFSQALFRAFGEACRARNAQRND